MPVIEFARLGFAGLTSQETVRQYRTAWEIAIRDGKAGPVALPDMHEKSCIFR